MPISLWRKACWPIVSARGISGSWSGSIGPASRLGARESAPTTFTRGCRRTAGEPSWRSSIRTPGRIRSGCWISCAARARSSSPDPPGAIFRSGPPMVARSSSAPIGRAVEPVCKARHGRGRGRGAARVDDDHFAHRLVARRPVHPLPDGQRLHPSGHLGSADRPARATFCGRQQRDATSGRRSSHPTDAGSRTRRTRVAARKSGFRVFRKHRKSGPSRPRVEASRSGAATVESCSTSRGT